MRSLRALRGAFVRYAEPSCATRSLRALRAADDALGLRLLAGGGVLVDRATRGRSVDRAYELLVLGLDRGCITVRDGALEPLRERLDRRAVAKVLEPLARRDADTLLLLLDVRHTRECLGRSRPVGRVMVAEALPTIARNCPRCPSSIPLSTRPWPRSAPTDAGSRGRRPCSGPRPRCRVCSASSARSSRRGRSERQGASTRSRSPFRSRTSYGRWSRTWRCRAPSFPSSVNCSKEEKRHAHGGSP